MGDMESQDAKRQEVGGVAGGSAAAPGREWEHAGRWYAIRVCQLLQPNPSGWGKLVLRRVMKQLLASISATVRDDKVVVWFSDKMRI